AAETTKTAETTTTEAAETTLLGLACLLLRTIEHVVQHLGEVTSRGISQTNDLEISVTLGRLGQYPDQLLHHLQRLRIVAGDDETVPSGHYRDRRVRIAGPLVRLGILGIYQLNDPCVPGLRGIVGLIL